MRLLGKNYVMDFLPAISGIMYICNAWFEIIDKSQAKLVVFPVSIYQNYFGVWTHINTALHLIYRSCSLLDYLEFNR